ncbi:MAG: flavodoxin domain-containing protein [Lentisphaeria bacterium]
MHTEIKPGIHWIGIVDWGLRHFHGHELSTNRGSTYNSYLILDEKIAVVDTVWAPFTEEFMANLRQLVDPARIDYVITNHAEPDHSGALPALMREAVNATMIVSRKGLESVPGHYHQNWPLKAVATGDTLSLGRRELLFVEAPMLHWPDSMFTYVKNEALLLSNDAFGQHYATAFRCNDQVDAAELEQEALKYYANILAPFSGQVIKKIDELLALKLPVEMIAPSHGVIWRQNPLQIVAKYQEWAAQKPRRQAVVLYESMWHATRRLAEAAGDGLAEAGVPHKLLYVSANDRNDLLTEIFQAGAVLVGSSTVNNGFLPSLAPVFSEWKGLRMKNKIGAAFGSYGWSGEAVKLMEAQLKECGVNVVHEGVNVKWQPRPDDLAAARALGRAVGETLKGETGA